MTANDPVAGSGDAAINAAEKRAEQTRHLNLPQFDDLPIPADTANLREGPNLHDACLALLPLVGVWRGEGEVVYPTIEGPYKFGQQVTFAHDGRPFLFYEARSWLLDDEGKVIRPAARETGFWRPQADDTIEVLLTHSSGILELYYGTPRTQTSWEIGTDLVSRTASAKDVTAAKRLYGLVNNGDLAYVEERAMMGRPMQPHTSAYLQRIVG
ncbi:FABP family protein [Actinokineospora xionganensis]|uniref:Peroxynitrite isomerase n=1 Tax=Actinokineospora xionganensis TaxID=2684470 RepID=A0ABR7L2D4_9PSEU|nr:FABP family protein [Actinokineospora xionganensis]MBC6446678.1 FABP family protein [Actinokineospora xionganensis]